MTTFLTILIPETVFQITEQFVIYLEIRIISWTMVCDVLAYYTRYFRIMLMYIFILSLASEDEHISSYNMPLSLSRAH